MIVMLQPAGSMGQLSELSLPMRAIADRYPGWSLELKTLRRAMMCGKYEELKSRQGESRKSKQRFAPATRFALFRAAKSPFPRSWQRPGALPQMWESHPAGAVRLTLPLHACLGAA